MKNKKRTIIILLILLLVVGISVYFTFFKKKAIVSTVKTEEEEIADEVEEALGGGYPQNDPVETATISGKGTSSTTELRVTPSDVKEYMRVESMI